MTATLREAAKQMEALEKFLDGVQTCEGGTPALNDAYENLAALRAALAEQPAPQVLPEPPVGALTDGEKAMLRAWAEKHARAILARAIPPGHVVVKDEPVAWVEVVNTYEGPYNFHGKELLAAGKHDLYAKVSAARPGGQHE